MITAIVFSKDRACQLDLFLQSISLNGNGLFEVIILFESSNEKFKEGYSIASGKYPSYDRFSWVEEKNFKEDTVDIVKSSNDKVCFFVDDNILYKKIPVNINDINNILSVEDSPMCLSLRMGKNTYIQNQYSGSRCIPPNKFTVVDDMFLVWNWKVLPPFTNFAYPFSMDGHIFRKDDVLNIISQYDFDTPNALEGRGLPFAHKLSENMASLISSCVVNTPLNLVGSSENMSGKHFGISLEDLNDKYLNGQSVDLESMDFSNIIGCHQELELKFKGELKC